MNEYLVLVVEDDKPIRNLITTTLKMNDYRFITAVRGNEAIMLSASHKPDIIILDLGLPDIDGVEVIEHIRTWSDVPIIIVSARSEERDKITALDKGADDYLTKPFLMQELLLRVQHILLRTYRAELARTKSKDLKLADRSVDLNDALVTLSNGDTIPLTATELALLRKLADNRGHIVTYDSLCSAVWGADYYGYENSLGVHIRHLRQKLEQDPNQPRCLLTVRGIGYKLAKEELL